MKNFLLAAIILFVSVLDSAAYASERVYQIDSITVTERPLFGGLGGSGHLGDITEFFVPELDIPLVSIGGTHRDAFANSSIIYIYKNDAEYFLCSEDRLTKECLPCLECVTKEDILKRFDAENREYIRKKTIGSFAYTVMEGGSETLRFSNDPQGLFSLTARHGLTGRNIDPGRAFQQSHKAYVMKAEDDPTYYLCPNEIFLAGQCYPCTDCEEKLEAIKAMRP